MNKPTKEEVKVFEESLREKPYVFMPYVPLQISRLDGTQSFNDSAPKCPQCGVPNTSADYLAYITESTKESVICLNCMWKEKNNS